jgi:DNA-binding transcriptional MerR regulator
MPKSISETGRLAGCSTATIRFYETIGLIPTSDRTSGGRRTFGWPDVNRLQFIRRARDFGISIDQIRDLLKSQTADPASCATARSIVQLRIDEIRQRQKELAWLESALQDMARRCDQSCGPAAAMPCTIFEDIGKSA